VTRSQNSGGRRTFGRHVERRNYRFLSYSDQRKKGEADVFRLYRAGKCRAIVSDDQKFLDLLTALNVPFVTPSALIVYAWRKRKIDKMVCLQLLEKLRPMVSEEEYHLAVIEIKGGD
jgi:hypothetical protein